jgi:prepilin-type N-terminal cleavage/methylation domain-containing protein
MLTSIQVKSGFTLVELMIALFLGSLLLSMVIGLYVNNITHGDKALKISKLRTDLQAIVGLMENDIRRAGFGGNAFMVGASQQKVVDSISTVTQKCIVYAYNYDDGIVVNSNHFMGFRYSTASKSIQFGKKVNPQANQCFNSGYWVNLTDPEFLEIHDLSFSESISTHLQATFRSIEIKVTAQLKSNIDYQHHISTKVQARNPESF